MTGAELDFLRRRIRFKNGLKQEEAIGLVDEIERLNTIIDKAVAELQRRSANETSSNSRG